MISTNGTLRLIRSCILALILGGTTMFAPAPIQAAGPAGVTAQLEAPVLTAAWYDHVLNSRSRTIQVVFVAVLIGAFMLRRSS
jgi:hypothetical protein